MKKKTYRNREHEKNIQKPWIHGYTETIQIHRKKPYGYIRNIHILNRYKTFKYKINEHKNQ